MVLIETWSPGVSQRAWGSLADPHKAEVVREALRGIRVRAEGSNEPVVIDELPSVLRVLGSGTDAVVVQHPELAEVAFKVYTPQTLGCLDEEYRAYQHLAGSPWFPVSLGRGAFYLVLSYESGPTLYECLVRGVVIDPQVIADVEAARRYARQVGLHPKDIHLKNVLVQAGRAKILDVSKYLRAGDEDQVWDHLAEGYRRFYPLIRGRRIPVAVIKRAKRLYRAQQGERFSLDAFATRMIAVLRAIEVLGPKDGTAA